MTKRSFPRANSATQASRTPATDRSPALSPNRRRQRGLTLIGLLISGIIIALIALVVMRVVPTVIEYFNIKKAVVRAASASPSGLPSEIRTAFDRSQAIDDFAAIAAKDLVITKVNDKTVVSFAYEKRIPLFGPASLLIEYKGDSKSN